MQKRHKMPHPALKDVLTATEAAALKEVDHSSVVRAIQRGDLLADQRQAGSKTLYLIHRRDLDAWTPERRGPKAGSKALRRDEEGHKGGRAGTVPAVACGHGGMR